MTHRAMVHRTLTHEWNRKFVSRLDWVGMVVGGTLFGTTVLLGELGIERSWWVTAIAILGVLIAMMPRWTRDIPRNHQGSTVVFEDNFLRFRNPNNNHYIEFSLTEIESVFSVDFPFFTYLRFKMRNKKYFSLYFYEVKSIVSELEELRVITKKASRTR